MNLKFLKMKIAIVGSGYVGLVTGACFAEVGIQVVCVDNDKRKISDLKKGLISIYEPGLDEIVKRNMKKGRLSFSSNLVETLKECNVVFISVGTPPDEDGSADLKHVLNVAQTCGEQMNDYTLVITKSTVPVGTSQKVYETIENQLIKRGLNIDFDVASNPEFLKEGAAIDDFLKPDRIVIGVESPRAEAIIKRLYKPFILNGHPIIIMDLVSAEMTKYAANSMLASKISFMNEIANLCELVGADVNLVRHGIGTDTRIGKKFIYPGIGYGGSCFPKDVKALIKTADDFNYDLRVLKAVEAVNQDQKEIIFRKILNYYGSDLKGKSIAVWGLSFKPQTSDMREAPSLTIINRLLNAGATVKVYDPYAIEEAKRYFGNSVQYFENQYEVLNNANCLCLLTEWAEFKYPKFEIVKNLLKEPAIFDGRNIYDKSLMKKHGFHYFGIGINSVAQFQAAKITENKKYSRLNTQ